MATITFKPKQVTKKILSQLQDRAYDVIVNRFGLDENASKKTLDAIGKKYKITRERVRQIENAAISAIRKSEHFKKEEAIFEELHNLIKKLGVIVSEEELLKTISNDKTTQNHIHFHLVLGDKFNKHQEDNHFKTRWTIDNDISEEIHDSLKKLYSSLEDDEIIPESEMIARFLDQIKHFSEEYKNEEVARRWLSLSKMISANPLGEWGKANSSNIRARGVKDYAFLVMRKHGSPMHFREVAKAITETFNRKTHTATCHNELIKDPRFVLIGRGLYGLTSWGYKKGVVKDVISDIIKKEGPMSKENIIDKVLKERYLKKNTILVNLQNPKYFKKDKNGLYFLA